MCDSYAGIDQSIDVEFTVLNRNEASREVFVHPEDEALDNEPTLFQQIIGQTDIYDSSDDEDAAENDSKDEQTLKTNEKGTRDEEDEAVVDSDTDCD